jgi:MFS superfamily sulfate permease-like transporter
MIFSAKDVTLGPTAIMSLMVSSVAGNGHGSTNLSDAIVLSFMSGLIQILLGVMRLG